MFIKLASFLALAATVTATTPFHTTNATSLYQDNGHGIKWTGVITPGQPKTTLFGTVDEIYNYILAINPNYVAQPLDKSDLALLASPWNEPGTTKLVARQRSKYLDKFPSPVCRVMATGNSRSLDPIINELDILGGICEAPKDACRRVGCKSTTAGYLCGEYGNAAVVACTDVSRRLEVIKRDCCSVIADFGGKPVSGHSKRYDYGVYAGYGNCNHGEDSSPADYPYPGGGINGKC
ncbi:uncharacterized protein PODANS_1_8540 [Podospora anserina S mat+]|uniref:Podospora anserina S mat+ genomic DNA chromosome 1, supercontig 1 n=4 Tax=Podospora TaxID=5144 RepID=B2A963_PODAN|nr:uncharacterized protein PODANS_1_8540 [Podospora anserina S mat+]KAK4659251.1 hypothetical protein QC762_108540 [Podospora pseudocomata]KAK4681570.1 hypothetical protein QC764_108540 [Podospora pseudoanserina]VBB72300.1 Putative protein of unknown function [Podospora comata]CAP60564.1 unnamed protein product [Podospora anserina S mat+]CDP23207.1 Putative protein of unknown function [Podospora anserina S mat+]